VGAPGGENGWQGRKALWRKRKRRCPDRQALRACVLAGRGQVVDLKEVLQGPLASGDFGIKKVP